MSQRLLTKLADKILIVGFIGAIWLPLIYSIPRFDHLELLQHYITANGWIKVRLMLVSSSDKVILGKDDWLFFQGDNSLENYLNLRPFSESELIKWGEILQERKEWLKKRKINYLLVIAPDKHTIYGEMLPDYYRPNPNTSRLDQLIAYLQKNTSVDILDLRPSLKAHKKLGKPLYHKTDTHWNELGGAIAASQIQKYLHRWYPEIKPLSFSKVQLKEVVNKGGDLARFLGLEFNYKETHYILSVGDNTSEESDPQKLIEYPPTLRIRTEKEETRSRQKNLPRAVIFQDSFAAYLKPYLVENFVQAEWLWSDGFEPEVVEKAKPDLVIQQFVERKLMIINPSNPSSMR